MLKICGWIQHISLSRALKALSEPCKSRRSSRLQAASRCLCLLPVSFTPQISLCLISCCHHAEQHRTGTEGPWFLATVAMGPVHPASAFHWILCVACFWGNNLASCQCISSCNSRQALPAGQNQREGHERDARDLWPLIWHSWEGVTFFYL